MQQVIKENDIPGIEVRRFTEALLVRPGQRDQGVMVWRLVVLPGLYGANAPAKLTEDRILLVEVDDPDDKQIADRVTTALNEQMSRSV